jgi:urate oxidase
MLLDTAYGKSNVRLVRLTRRSDGHDLCDLTVSICFQGDYDDSYVDGDNRDVLPTDTMRNTVYALAAAGVLQDPETFGITLGRHFLDRNPRLHRVRIDLTEHPWARIGVDGRDDGHSFVRGGPEMRSAFVTANRQQTIVEAGIVDLEILKSARSQFVGFMRDEYTTLTETRDRILATSLTTRWHYRHAGIDFGATWRAVRRALLESFARHDSASVQHTLYAMGRAVIERVDEVAGIHLVMPNKHHLPVDLSRFGLENRNEIFVATDEPYGLIEATISR